MKTNARKRKKMTQETAAFSFSSGLAPYANKEGYVTGNVTFAIVTVEFDPGGGYTGEDRWKVSVMRDDTGEIEIVTLPANTKRDAQLQEAKKHIAAHGVIANVRLVKRGNAYYFRTGEPRGS